MSIGNKLRYQVLRRDNYTCRYCGAFAPVAKLVVDHVTPRKHGGPDALENLVTACDPCNSGKSATLPEFWIVQEIEQASNAWLGLPNSEPDEDDLFEQCVYQDFLYELEALTASEVIHWIAEAYIAAMPYRPTHSELIRCAGMLARQHRLQAAGN